jgi:hypothetical protein
MRRISLFIIIFLFFSSFLIADESKENAFTKMISEIYNFYPSEVSKEIKDKKSKEMDKLWVLVESDKNLYLPLLRKELQKPNQNKFFYYDGSSLLLKNSESKEDMLITIQAINKAPLIDVINYDYFRMVHWIGTRDINIFPAIENMLSYPQFKIFIPEHVLTLGQDYSTLYCFLVLDDSFYLDQLIQRLKIEKDPTTIKTIIISLAYTVTEKGQKAINDFINSNNDIEINKYAKNFSKLETKEELPKKEIKSERKYINQFLEAYTSREFKQKEFDVKGYSKDLLYIVKKEDYTKIKEFRKKQARRVSDEALGEIEYLTLLMQYALTSKD